MSEMEEEMKKVLFLNSDLCSGGAERAMAIIANQFQEAGYDVTMALLRPNKVVYKVNDEIDIIQFKNDAKGKIGKFIKRIWDIRKTVKLVKPDVTVSFTTGNNIITIISCIGLKTKVVVSERLHPLLTIDGVPISCLRKFKINLIYPYASKIVFQTEMARNCLNKRTIQDKSVVIPNAVEASNYKTLPVERNKTVIAAGRFSKQKNFEMLIKAFAEFYKSHQDYKLIIYGKGNLEEDYHKLAKQLHIEQVFQTPGHVSNLKDIMHTAGMYISSSDFEGISNSMLEALAEGTPSICTDCPVGGAAMVIQNGVNGILVPVGDIGELVQAMDKIASDEGFANEISKNATYISKTYSTEKIRNLWIEIIEQL